MNFFPLPAAALRAALLLSVFLGLTDLNGAERSEWKFSFGASAARVGYTVVQPNDVYSLDRGYGFEPPGDVSSNAVVSSSDGASAEIISERPFLFSAAVPEGNYRVKVTFGGGSMPSITTIKAESRRLMVEQVKSAAGEFVTREFIVNVRNAKVPPPPLDAPGNDHVELNNREQPAGRPLVFNWDEKLTLEFTGVHLAVATIELARVENLPTVFIVGDSTVTDQPEEPGASWGQMLPRFFRPEIAIANHAESGETLKSFITELRLDKVLSQMKRGDFLLIQFGHNDEKSSWPQTYVDANTTYRSYLKVFIAEARLRGATPVLCSPVQRRQFDGGKIKNSHGLYPEAVRAVAAEERVAFIDLAAMSARLYEALGPANAPLAFSANGTDVTHHNNYGAYEIAQCVVQGLRDAHVAIANDIVPEFQGFDPSHPDAVEAFTLPASPRRTTQTPRGN